MPLKVGKLTFYSPTEIEREFEITRVTVWKAIKTNRLKAQFVAGRPLIEKREIKRFLKHEYHSEKAFRKKRPKTEAGKADGEG